MSGRNSFNLAGRVTFMWRKSIMFIRSIAEAQCPHYRSIDSAAGKTIWLYLDSSARQNHLKRSSVQIVFALWMLLLFFPGNVFASVTASISGTVTDANGGLIPAIGVTVTNVDTGVIQNTTSNGTGFYIFPALEPGTYNLSIHQTGFKAFQKTDIVLKVNDVVSIDASLQIGSIQEVITVSSNTLHVETSSTQLGEVIGSSE